MGFEELLDKVGGFGPFQLRNLLLMALPRVLLPLHFLLPIFLAAVPPHHCALPGTPGNLSHQDLWLEAHLPREPDGTFSSCLRFAHPQALPNASLGREANSSGELEGEPSTSPCSQGWEYDRSEFSSTIATEWDLVCTRKGLNKATSTFFFVGVLVGAVVYGYLSDRFGRRPLLLVAYVSSLLLSVASAASVNYVMFVVFRTLTGFALSGFTIIVLPLELEWLDVKHRTVAGVLSTTFWTGGVMLLALTGYLIRDWRWLLLAVTLPCVPGILSIWWVPESARWLLTQGRVAEAQRYLLRCARLNRRDMGEDSLSEEVSMFWGGFAPSFPSPEITLCSRKSTWSRVEHSKRLRMFWLALVLNKVATMEKVVRRPSYLDLFRTPQLRHISLCCMVMWFGVNFSYYGLTLDLSGLGLTVYQTQLLFGAVELPSKLVVFWSVRYAGRRLTEAGMLLGAALTFGLRVLVASETESWTMVVVVMGKSFSEAAFTTAYLFTSELYPTVLRQTGLGLASLVGRLGGSLAPLAGLLDEVWLSLPKVVYGGAALLAACTALLLPETRTAQLPETIQDVERKSVLATVQEEEMQVQN